MLWVNGAANGTSGVDQSQSLCTARRGVFMSRSASTEAPNEAVSGFVSCCVLYIIRQTKTAYADAVARKGNEDRRGTSDEVVLHACEEGGLSDAFA